MTTKSRELKLQFGREAEKIVEEKRNEQEVESFVGSGNDGGVVTWNMRDGRGSIPAE
jgi:hypothetical protein